MGKQEDNTTLDILEQTEVILDGECSFWGAPWSLVTSCALAYRRQACSGRDAHAAIGLLLWTCGGVFGNLYRSSDDGYQRSAVWMHDDAPLSRIN